MLKVPRRRRVSSVEWHYYQGWTIFGEFLHRKPRDVGCHASFSLPERFRGTPLMRKAQSQDKGSHAAANANSWQIHYVSVTVTLVLAMAPPCMEGNSPLPPSMTPLLFSVPPEAATRAPTGWVASNVPLTDVFQ
jgi:hypothetical protein